MLLGSISGTKVLNFQYLMYHTCSSFIIPGNITVNYLLAITIFSPSQKPLAEIHKWKCSLISFVMVQWQPTCHTNRLCFGLAFNALDLHNKGSYLLHFCWAMVNVIVPIA